MEEASAGHNLTSKIDQVYRAKFLYIVFLFHSNGDPPVTLPLYLNGGYCLLKIGG
jgi:hypothetical protein